MLRHPNYTRKRIRQITERFSKRFYAKTTPIEDIKVSDQTDRIPYEQAVKLPFKPVKMGATFGPVFATYWFKVIAQIPEHGGWAGQRVDLLWNTHSENTLWLNDRSSRGLNFDTERHRPSATLLDKAKGGEQIQMYLEMACNGLSGEQLTYPNSDNANPNRLPFFLDMAKIGLFDPMAWDIYHDLKVLGELEQQLSEVSDEQINRVDAAAACQETKGGRWAGKLLFELNRFCNEIDEDDRSTWPAAREILQTLLENKNGTCAHELSAIGHAHIDSAWLWPKAETVRKCTRSFSTAISYMQRYPEYKFACSQAWQYEVIQQTNPDLYQRIEAAVKRGQWIPVGGTWIEPDCNIPSGESLCRQFLLGQRYFEKAFGKRCTEFWNPDVFGYNGQLPQIMRQAGVGRFLTQKLSWNKFNQPMHHTFNWQGIDGSQILAHFPPADTYNATCSIEELRKHGRNYKENDRSDDAYYLFGYGDGGGGPTETMLEVLRRTEDLQGVPRCAMRTSEEFFTRLENNIEDTPVVTGELYFELHRGTYTTQARTKKGNRKGEGALHDIEAMAAIAVFCERFTGSQAASGTLTSYPREQINELWKILLFNQFHDVLPGSSIRKVYEDAEADYAKLQKQAAPLRAEAAKAFAKTSAGIEDKVISEKPAPRASNPGLNAHGQDAHATKRGSLDAYEKTHSASKSSTPINTISFDRAEVASDPDGNLVWAEAKSYGTGQIKPAAPDKVTVEQNGDKIIMENAQLKATLDKGGQLRALLHKQTGRQALAAPGNALKIYDDHPTQWEAWDVDPFHLETEQDCAPAEKCKITCKGPLRGEVTFKRQIGKKSKLTQAVRLDAGSKWLSFDNHIDWQEQRTFLKVAFPLNVKSDHATYEMQFGNTQRPTHFNDTQALAKFEVPGHKWADMSEYGFGASLLSESKYGYSARGNTLYMSLLRATQSPDPIADLGAHDFSYAIYPHAGTWQEGGVVEAGYKFNAPLLWADGAAAPHSFFAVDDNALVLETVKQAEDDNALILRLYEPYGSRGKTKLRLGLPAQRAVRCNTLEDEGEKLAIDGSAIELDFKPYELISIKLR